MKLKIIPLIALAVTCSSCGQREEFVSSPLVWKYLGMPGTVSVVKVYGRDGRQEPYAVWWNVENPPKRTHLTWKNEGVYIPGEIESRRYPELTHILTNAGVIISNGFVARDIRDLMDVVMKQANDITRQDYLVEDVVRTGNVWIVEAGYWGPPDDWHRRPSRVVYRIMVNESNMIQDVIEEVHPRPMDTEKWKHNTNGPTVPTGTRTQAASVSAEPLTPATVFSGVYEAVFSEVLATHKIERFTLALDIRDSEEAGVDELTPLPKGLLTAILKRKKQESVFIPPDQVERFEETRRHPKAGEYIVQGWRDKRDKKPVDVLTAGFTWRGANDAVVNYAIIGGPLSSRGGAYLVRWKDGAWSIIKKMDSWVS